MKPRQHARTEGCPIQTAATRVTGGCVTTKRSAVVPQPQSGLFGLWVYYPASEVSRIFIGENEA